MPFLKRLSFNEDHNSWQSFSLLTKERGGIPLNPSYLLSYSVVPPEIQIQTHHVLMVS
jgi:hypothetical protein